MAEITTVARPYAEAAFKTALEQGHLGPMGEGLDFLALALRDEQVRSLISNPKVSARQKKDFFDAIGGDRLDAPLKNLVGMLVDAHREVLIGSIAEQFDELKREHEKVLRARITSAQPLSDEQRTQIVGALERRYGKRIEAELDVDPELLGGARVQIGDQVIHASMRDALGQMAAALAR